MEGYRGKSGIRVLVPYSTPIWNKVNCYMSEKKLEKDERFIIDRLFLFFFPHISSKYFFLDLVHATHPRRVLIEVIYEGDGHELQIFFFPCFLKFKIFC